MMRVWFLPSPRKRARIAGSGQPSGTCDDAARLAQLAEAPEMVALYGQPTVALILCAGWTPDLAPLRARFDAIAVCLVVPGTGDEVEPPPGDLPPNVTVARIDAGQVRALSTLARNFGPNLIVDRRPVGLRAKIRAFAQLYPSLRHGGVYAIDESGWAGSLAEKVRRHLFERRITHGRAGARIARAVGYRLVTKAARPPVAVELVPARDASAQPPVSLGAPGYTRIRPHLIGATGWVADQSAAYGGQAVVPPEALVCRLSEATVFGPGIVQVGGAIVAESLLNLDPGQPLGALILGENGKGHVSHTLVRPRRIPGRTIHLWQTWAENYGHWLIECLPRLHMAARAGLLDGAKVTVQRVPGMMRVYRESLAAFGIGEERIVWLDGRETVFQELIYPTPITRQPAVKSPLVIEAADALRARIGPGTSASEDLGERIYVSRNAGSRRRLVNEAAVVTVLAERGYRIVHPEAETFARQVRIFAAARFVVGGMGAALSNLAFAPHGVRCLMLTNQGMVDDFFLDLASLKDGHYVSLHGTSLSPELGMQSDYTIDVATLREALDAHGF